MASPSIKLNDGSSTPWLAFGTGNDLSLSDASKEVEAAIRAGFRHIDTAQMYANEDSVGAGINAAGVPREELYVATKLDELKPGETVLGTLKESLRKLQLDYIDIFLIHLPIQHADVKAVWKELEEAKAAGLTKSIGVSNFTPKYLREVLESATVVPAVNQIEYHPYVLTASTPILDIHRRHSIITASFGGLGPITRAKGELLDPVLEKIAKRVSETSNAAVTPGQILQLWLRKKGIPCITSTRKTSRMLEYLALDSLPDLTDTEVDEIDQTGGKEHHLYYAGWMDSDSQLG